MRSIIVVAALALAVGVLAPRYFSNISPAPAPAAPQARPLAPAPAADARSRSVVIARNAQGPFVVDHGASVLRIASSPPARHGIHPSRNAFVTEVKTANGTVRAAPAQLDVV